MNIQCSIIVFTCIYDNNCMLLKNTYEWRLSVFIIKSCTWGKSLICTCTCYCSQLSLQCLQYCIRYIFRVHNFSRFWTRSGTSRGFNFAIYVLCPLLYIAHRLKWKFSRWRTREIRENKTPAKITAYTVHYHYVTEVKQ